MHLNWINEHAVPYSRVSSVGGPVSVVTRRCEFESRSSKLFTLTLVE